MAGFGASGLIYVSVAGRRKKIDGGEGEVENMDWNWQRTGAGVGTEQVLGFPWAVGAMRTA